MSIEGTFRTKAEGAYKAVLEEIRPLSLYMRVLPLPRVSVPSQIRKDLREEFDAGKKADFIYWLATHREQEMKAAFGLHDVQISSIRNNRYISGFHLPLKLNMCSVDHIIPLSVGGGNDVSNLSLIPEWINHLKARFEDAQLRTCPDRTHINILVPTRDEHGNYVSIPCFPDQFYTPRSKVMRKHAEWISRNLDLMTWQGDQYNAI